MFRHTKTTFLTILGTLLATAPTVAQAAPGVISTTATQRAAAATVAAGKVRSPYGWGATGPSSFDCSGLVTFAYRAAGRPLAARTSHDLFRHGAPVRRAALRRGDLVWTWDRGRGHVGMYLGRNRYVHAPGRGRRVEVASLPSGGGFVGAVRP